MPATRINITGPAVVFITTTVTKWAPIFKSDETATEIMLQLQETTDHFNVAVLGYVVMPSHVHMLLGFHDIKVMSEFMKAFKRLTSSRLKNLDIGKYRKILINNGKFNLWMRRFDDLVIYSEKQFKTKLEYIHNNPVKDGFVAESTGWKYSSARDWLQGEKGVVEIEKDCEWLNV